jgi:outer membrane protein assembly factor BamE (lipoprotein component of BamABCDE complex)
MKRPLISALLVLGLLAGCASPDTRIKDNPGIYSGLTPEQQALVKKGEIALGMPEAGVQLALGKPDRVTEHTDAGGVQKIWHYTVTDTYGGEIAVGYPWYPHHRFGPDPYFYPGFHGFYAPYPIQTESDRMRVVFKDGKVTAIERES